VKVAVKVTWWQSLQGHLAKPLPPSSRASPRLVVLTTDRGSFRELDLALEGLASEGGSLPQGPRAPPRAVVPLTTRFVGHGP